MASVPLVPKSAEEPELCVKDDLFFFDNIVFKVERTLFRVPKHGFCVEGTAINDMFSLPTAGKDESEMDGSNEKHPIVLEGILKDDFRAFLKVLYPFAQTRLTREEWTGALNLSTMWLFTEIRQRAISELSTMIDGDVCSKIILAKKYRVEKWLLEGYSALVEQHNLPEINQLIENGIDSLTLARLYYIRNYFQINPLPAKPSAVKCGNLSCALTHPHIHSAFGDVIPPLPPAREAPQTSQKPDNAPLLKKIRLVFFVEFMDMET